ncbi:hypothetical protein CAPI_04290 [Corynebacterium capitovis DSM 44611]|uniref:aminotransferase class IV n=1 Tax=Corynebacterium capitovis TaxID=131081 RepID=UPI0003649EEE|nr:aminotransferase class IV [Corynebacterium capitovis]WKD57416.1 hypothetical protein CAPI_04290 [Corynebacterium capitovis DSM 44611]
MAVTVYTWAGRWVPSPHGPRIIDRAESWRHAHGRARFLELHMERFGPAPPGLWDEALSLLDAPADLFPRLARAQGRFYLEVRPAPARRERTRLALVDAPDPRRSPTVKGPDLARLAAHRQRHLPAGTDDVVLGTFAETTTGALVGWRGTTLVTPRALHLPSTTQKAVVARARSLGHPVIEGELDPCEPLWFCNALHGISPVSTIVSAGDLLSTPRFGGEGEWVGWWADPMSRS